MLRERQEVRLLARRPRILFVVNVDSFFVSHRLALGEACLARDYEVVVCAAESAAADRIRGLGMRFIPLDLSRGGTDPRRDARTLLQLLAVYRREKPDIVHHVTIKPVLYGSLAARVLGLQRVVNAISGLGYAFIPRPRDGVAHRILRRGLWLAYRAALRGGESRVIFQNDTDRSTFVERRVIDAHRTRLIAGSGVDMDFFRAAPLPERPFTAVLPARLLRDKGVEEFVHAARTLKARYPEARFLLVGPVDTANPAGISKELLASWVDQGWVEWLGDTPRERMPDIYQSAHVVVLPSYREGLPLVLAEASACGRACVTTDVPGCRDAVIPGQTGWLVPARDAVALASALEECIVDPEQVRRRGLAAADFARERFDVKLVVRQTLDVYDELLRAYPLRPSGAERRMGSKADISVTRP